jgi:hypothetical protein
MELNAEEILEELGGINKNNLLDIVNSPNEDNLIEQIFDFKQSNYYNFEGTKSFQPRLLGAWGTFNICKI